MKERNKLIRVFTGSEVIVILLKARLEEVGVSSMIQNDYKSGIEGGFVGGVQSAIDLYIHQSDYKKATPVINEIINSSIG